MTTETLTIGQTITEIRRALKDYIEATYHISHPSLVAHRKQLLEEPGAIYQAPFLESTPRYKAGKALGALHIHDAAKELLLAMAEPTEYRDALIHDPPYRHQADAIEATVSDG
ncbi:MAG: hypothetical protein F4Z31_22920, partial [Gemmatimonadetes bacterium]|nr:hypothetical protein [Gemmatimonadota bacterium]